MMEDGEKVTLGEVTVTYDGTCEAELQPAPSCPQFTITIEDQDEIGRPNVTVTLEHKDSNAPVITATTDENGEFIVPTATTQTGVYKVYEGNQLLGEITITYKNDNCETTLIELPTCEQFTLVVKDV